MDLLGQYSDDEEVVAQGAPASKEDGIGAKPKQAAKKPPFSGSSGLSLALPSIEAAPEVDLLGATMVLSNALNPSAKTIYTNPTCDLMYKPMKGPVPVGQNTVEQKFQNHQLGTVEKASMSLFAFDKEYLTFHNFGYAANPSKNKTSEDREVLESTEAKPQHGKGIWDKASKRRRMAEPG